MKIGISINEIVRDLWTKVKSVHEKYYDSKIEGELTEKNVLEKLNLDEDSLLDFLFDEAPMEIFGHSKEVSNNFIRALNEFIVSNPNLEIYLLSDEVGRGISSTYWFLAKYGSHIKNVKFIRQKEKKDIWNYFDIIITNDEKIIKNKSEGKTLISTRKFKNVDFKIKKPKDILSLEVFRNDG